MSPAPKGLYRLGGASFILSGVLFLSKHLLERVAGQPPSSGAEILAWVDAGRLPLSLANELGFFALMALIPALIALHRSLGDAAPVKAATACGVMAVTLPVLAMLVILQGRLVYPVRGLPVTTPAVAELIVAVLSGGLHLTNLLFAAATFMLSLAARRSAYGAPVASLGFATAAFDIVGAYPYAIGASVAFVCQAFFGAWFVVLGLKLYQAEAPVPLLVAATRAA